MVMKTNYSMNVAIRYYGLMPDEVSFVEGHVTGPLPALSKQPLGVSEWLPSIQTATELHTASDKPFDLARWKQPPHLFFANLNLDAGDLGPVYKFTREYGYVKGCGSIKEGRFWVDVPSLKQKQEAVRDVWRTLSTRTSKSGVKLAALASALSGPTSISSTNLSAAKSVLHHAAARLITGASMPEAGLKLIVGPKESEIATADLWTLMQVLLFRDVALKSTGLCPNPDCVAPYFMKKRKTQKFCEKGDCVAFAQRQYALRWWRSKGEQWRAKKGKVLSQRRKKP